MNWALKETLASYNLVHNSESWTEQYGARGERHQARSELPGTSSENYCSILKESTKLLVMEGSTLLHSKDG